MSASVFDHSWVSGLFSAPGIALHWCDARQLAHMLAFERALTEGLQRTGRISDADATQALRSIDTFQPDLEYLKTGAARDGLVVPELVAQLRTGLATGAAIHSGATSQDVIDTATALTLRDISTVIVAELHDIIAALEDLKTRAQGAQIMGRTRMQAALPIDVAQRISAWQCPLVDHIDRLETLAPSVFRLQLGGAVGDRSAFGQEGDALAAQMAKTLNLHPAPRAWPTAAGLSRLANGSLWSRVHWPKWGKTSA